jgi:polyisoprenoid-binding protein YceI
MLTILSLLINTAMAAPQNYGFLSNKGLLFVTVNKADTLLSGVAHDHAIQAVGWSGKATWDVDDFSACSLVINVPVNNLAVDKPSVRKAAGLSGEVSESQQKEIKGNMLSKGQLNASEHPMITFKSTSCSGSGNNATINGNFTMRGVTKAVSVPATVNTSNGLQIKGSFYVKATDYGFKPYEAAGGTIANEDKMKITLDLQSASN